MLRARELFGPLAVAYGIGWMAVFTVAGACALIPPSRWLAHHALAIDLPQRIRPAPAPNLATFGWLLVTNVRATAWPIVPAWLHAERYPATRRLVHSGVLIGLAANLLPAAAALGVYRGELIPYLPHLPLELYAITAGPACWVLTASGRCVPRQVLTVALTIVVALAVAAGLETWAVPHR